ncbi:MAG: nucleotidyltransferase family protein [Labilithrix sp.]|nr:nucleotidyltransferase family protein [Labilithrix sp.]
MPSDSETTRAVWVRQTAGARALGALVAALGVREVLPVKGIVTARTLYADPAERTVADVDVRVSGRAALERVLAFARDRDHRVWGGSRAYDNVVVDVGGVDVDVECHVGPPGLCGLRVAEMLARSTVRDDVFGFPCAIPEPHDHALLMVVNAFKDKLVNAAPASVEDLHRMAAAPGFEPERLAAIAREARSVAITWIVADWLSSESETWRDVRNALGARPPRRAYVHLYRWLVDRAPTSLAARVLARAASDDVVERVRALGHALAFSRE